MCGHTGVAAGCYEFIRSNPVLMRERLPAAAIGIDRLLGRRVWLLHASRYGTGPTRCSVPNSEGTGHESYQTVRINNEVSDTQGRDILSLDRPTSAAREYLEYTSL